MKEEREEPKAEAAEEPKIVVDRDPDQKQESEAADQPKAETERESEPDGGQGGSIQDGLELDRMEVRPASEMEEEQEGAGEVEEVVLEAPEREESVRPNILAMLADYGIWIFALFFGLSAVSAVLLFVLTPGGEPDEVKLGKRVHAVSASLGGEHYVRFNLWGPFRDFKGQAALRRGMPRIRHDLILSGGRPEVARAIQENDLYFLEKLILGIVSNATGIPVGELDLKGLSVTRYSDEAEVEGEG